MDPQRKTQAGPMAPSSLKTARKSFAVINTYIKSTMPEKEIITVRTSAPSVEKRASLAAQNQVYHGEVNVLSIIETNKEIMCCKYTEDQNGIAAGFGDGTIRLFDCNNGTCIHTLVDDECRAYPGPVTAIKHRPVSKAHPITNMLLSCYVNGCIKCWKYKYDQCLYTIREKRQTLGLNYHPRYSKFVTYGDDAKLNMYDEEAQTQERAFYSSQRKNIIDGHTSRIFACAFNPKSHHELISGGWDDTVMCWDDRQPYATKHFFGVHMCGEGLDFDKPGKQNRKNIIDGHTSRIFACAFNPKSHHELISGGWDDTVMCWDDRQPYATKHFFGVHMCGEGLDFDKPGKQILTCSWQEKNSIQLWDYGSCKLIETIVPDIHQSKLYCGKFVPQTNLIVCGGSDSNILRVVDINMKTTECSIRNNPGAVYSYDFSTIRRKVKKVPDTYKKVSEIDLVPRVAFVTGKRLQTVDFG